jgi:hypothetical protein
METLLFQRLTSPKESSKTPPQDFLEKRRQKMNRVAKASKTGILRVSAGGDVTEGTE